MNIPQINFVDVLVFGEDASVVSTARRLRSGGFGVAVFLTGAAQEAGLDSGALGELIGSGADLLLETTPVAPLVSGGRWLCGWVVLCSSGYLAVPARAVVDATRGRLLASQVPPGVCGLVGGTLEDNPQLVDIEQLSELKAIPVKTSGAIDSWAAGTELVWHYESPRYAGCSRRLPLEFAGAHSATATEVLVVGGGQSGLAAAKAARAKGAHVLCIVATAGIFPE
ncbi:MAG: hypothetical protein J6Y80_05895, partial [Victivallales bacterium]|nr:hypothetical protein [Victivallales bacterium]